MRDSENIVRPAGPHLVIKLRVGNEDAASLSGDLGQAPVLAAGETSVSTAR